MRNRMTPDDILEALAARVEKKADRELDVAIARAAGAAWFLGHAAGLPDAMLTNALSPCPHFTSRLDGSVLLEDPAWLVTIEKEPGGVTAIVTCPVGERWEKTTGEASGDHAEARARTAANLRARAMEARDAER